MQQAESIFEELTADDFEKIKARAVERSFKKGDVVFSEGDDADYIYFIETGRISIYIQKFTSKEDICTLGPGEHFGEMAVYYKNKRNASAAALEDTTVLGVEKKSFIDLVKTDRAIADKINFILARRNEELILKENLIESTGLASKHLHVSIKGDPSLRESTFTRERYESMVDKVLPKLVPQLEELLLNRGVYQIFVGFNNGEIRTASVFDPFGEELHPVNKIIDEAYVDRHFPVIPYKEKAWMIKRIYGVIAKDTNFDRLAGYFRKFFSTYYEQWEPIPVDEIKKTLARLTDLRSIPDFYLRNFAISMTRDAIRMQFNCDGTHIVSAEDYQQFLQDNLE
jgi:CRP-like cAMP-binding protein